MEESTTTVVLVPGHWLGGWAWQDVEAHLQGRDVRTVAVTLPGMDPADPDRATRSLQDQADALLEALAEAAARGPVVLVAHSGANGPASVALDRRPDLVQRMVWVDSGPVADGAAFAPDLPDELVELPLPPFDELGKQASLEGLDEDALTRFRERSVPEPGPVLRGHVQLGNAARRDVPTTMVCCSFPSEQVQLMAASGHPMMTETATLRDITYADLPTGHWPMWSRPAELAELLHAAATSLAS